MATGQSTAMIMGANGRLGRSLVDAFVIAGFAVRAQVRDPSRWNSSHWPEGVEPVFCDARDQSALCQAAKGADVLVNALNPAYTQWSRHALLLNEYAVATARACGALLLFPGNIYNFGSHLPKSLRETTPQIGDTSKARMRIQMEDSMRSAAAEGVDCVVLRSGDYFGGQRGGSWFDQVITKDLKKGKVVYPGATDRVHAWVYLPDFAHVFPRVAALRGQLTGFQTYQFPGYAITGAELHEGLEVAAGQALRLTRMSWWPLRLAAPISPMARAILEMRYLWFKPHRLDDGALTELVGPLPQTPLHSALQASLRDLGLLPTYSVEKLSLDLKLPSV